MFYRNLDVVEIREADGCSYWIGQEFYMGAPFVPSYKQHVVVCKGGGSVDWPATKNGPTRPLVRGLPDLGPYRTPCKGDFPLTFLRKED